MLFPFLQASAVFIRKRRNEGWNGPMGYEEELGSAPFPTWSFHRWFSPLRQRGHALGPEQARVLGQKDAAMLSSISLWRGAVWWRSRPRGRQLEWHAATTPVPVAMMDQAGYESLLARLIHHWGAFCCPVRSLHVDRVRRLG